MKNLRIYSNRYSTNKNRIHRLVGFLRDELSISIGSLEINFINPEQIEKINSSYLKHKYPTDIITFSYSELDNVVDAELFICPEVADLNARKYRAEPESEIFRLVIHGILHVSGYDDKSPALKKKMKLKENRLLKQFLVMK